MRRILLKTVKRKIGQKLLIETSDGTVEISISSASLGEVKLEIDAPVNIEIVREELIRNSEYQLH
jgi:sRNA-binding carbon storage regulator CsrA